MDEGCRIARSALHEKALGAAEELRDRFGFDFVGVSVVGAGASPLLEWQHAAGSTTRNYEMIKLPGGVGALGKVYDLGRGIVVDSVDDDIPKGELFQYPIVIAEALSSFFAFPLMEGDRIRVIVIGAFRFVRTFDELSCGMVQQSAARLFGLQACPDAPLWIHGKQEGFAYAEITHRLLQAQESERRRIARELHDGISQEVLVAQIELRKLGYLPWDEWPAAVERVSERLRDVISHIGAIARALRPAALDGLGLPAAMEALCVSMSQAFGVEISTALEDVGTLGEDREIALYRIFQEALSNACKYASARLIEVSLSSRVGVLTLRVADDGAGFDPGNVPVRGSGLGLEGMAERARLIGGVLDISSSCGGGTEVKLTVGVEEGA